MSRRRVWLIVLCFCLPLTLAGCPQGGGNPYTLSTLRIAGLRHLPGLERILDGSNKIGSDAVIFQAPGDPTPRALLNAAGQLEEVGLDGSGERSLATTSPCAGTPAVTPDGQWGACLSYDTHYQADQVEFVSLAAGTSRHSEVHMISGFYYGLVWSPDGSHLALVGEFIENDNVSTCSIQIYSASADFSTLELTTTFTSDVFASYGTCEVLGVGWSPDGMGLDIAVKSSDALLVDEHVAVTSSILAANANVAIPGGQFASAPIGTPFEVTDSAWNPQTGTLALISNSTQAEGKMLRYYPTTERQVGTWFVISDTQHTLLRLAWSPDGRQLLLIVGGPSCLDNCAGIALPDVYLYTPPMP